MSRITESASKYDGLEKMSFKSLLKSINAEDKLVPLAIEKCLGDIELLTKQVHLKLSKGGRLFYIGAGTSGRLGIVDASECPPTFGVSADLVVGIIAGGDTAIRKAVEFAEDDQTQAWKDLSNFNVNSSDIVIGIAASGTTPYVVGGINDCNKHNITTGCITCNHNSPLAAKANYPIEIVVGPEFVTGSTRMKAGTAQKLVLNMITTSVMVKLGRVKGNRMVDMQLSNDKLVERGTRMVMDATDTNYDVATKLLRESGSVREAIKKHQELTN